MPGAPLPPDEAERQRALDGYDVLDTLPEQDFDDLTLIAAAICGTPIALVSLLDRERQWFKSAFGLGAKETPRELAFCGYAIQQEGVMEVPDAPRDDRFRDNALVLGDPNIRFYAGAPLINPDGHALGTLCVIDRVPRQLATGQRDALAALARQVVARLEARRQAQRLAHRAAFPEENPHPTLELDLHGRVAYANPAARAAFPDLDERRLAHPFLAGLEPQLAAARAGASVSFQRELHVGGRVLLQVARATPGARGLRIYANDLTRLREEERRLRESEERHRTVVDAVRDYAIFALSPEGVIESWNEGATRLTGYPADEAVGSHLSRFHLPEDIARGHAAEQLRLAARDGRHEEEGIRLRKDGSRYHAHIVLTARRDAAGALLGFTKVTRDVTERKASEEALRLRERALEAATAGISIADARDPSLPLIYVNPAFERITGYTAQEALGRNCRFLQGPGTDPEEVGRLREAIAARRVHRATLRNYRKDGRPFWNDLVVAPVCDSAGVVTHLVGIQLDVTERVQAQERARAAEAARAERELEERESRYRSLIANVSEVITLVDDKGVIRYESPSVEAVLGHRPEELIGSHVFEHVHPDDVPHAMAKLAEALARPRTRLLLELRCRHRDGSWRDFEVVGSNMLEEPGVNAIALASRDVTERKRIEREAAAQRELLARNERLSALGILVAGVAHEINNPLTYVRGNVKFALEVLPELEEEIRSRGGDKADDLRDVREGLESAVAGSDRIAQIAKALKVFARQSPKQHAPLDLADVVREVETLVRGGASPTVALSFDIASAAPIAGNATEIHQVLLNLVKNAIEALAGREGKVAVACDARDGWAELVVQDDGPGISAEARRSLFTPFMTTKAQGTGLGLSIAHSIIREHHGEILVESEEGAGARFRVRLPLRAA